MKVAYHTSGAYTGAEWEIRLDYLKRKIKRSELPFNMLAETEQQIIMDKLSAYFPTPCPACNKVDEPDFQIIGICVCPHCGTKNGFVSIARLPEIDSIKQRIWTICGKDLDKVKALGLPEKEGWLQWWKVYLKARKKYMNG